MWSDSSKHSSPEREGVSANAWQRRLSKVKVASLALSCLLSACSTLPPPSRWPQAEALGAAVAAQSQPILLLGDTQEHSLEGLPHGFLTGYLDRLAADVTIRPPQQALFGRKLFEAITTDTVAAGKTAAIVHLGDLLDHSCEIELQRMKTVLLGIDAPFVLAPGNHDGIFQGIFNPAHSNAIEFFSQVGWDYVCRTPDARGHISAAYGVETMVSEAGPLRPPRSNLVSKDRLLDSYIEMQLTKGAFGAQDWCEKQGYSICYQSEKHPLSAAYGRIRLRDPACTDPGHCPNYSESFLTQVMSLSGPGDPIKIKLILMDTTQLDFEYVPILNALWNHARNPGSTGRMLKDQLALVADLAAKADAEGDVLILGGHHDWRHLDEATRSALSGIYKKMKHGPVYLSAHTHNGFWGRHDVGDDLTLLEFNVSSMADWPLDARRVVFRLAGDRQTVELQAGSVVANTTGPSPDETLLNGWREKTCGHPDAKTLLDSADFDKFVVDQQNLVDLHNDQRGTLETMVGHYFARHFGRKKEAERVFLYPDNFNDNRNAIAAFALLMKWSPGFSAWAESKPVGAYKTCSQGALKERLQCAITTSHKTSETLAREYDAARLAGVPKEERPPWGLRESYGMLALTVGDLQKAIDSATLKSQPGIVRLMACAHWIAAERDWRGGRRTLPLDRNFFQQSALSRRKS
jgi:hypothetical protein